MGNNDNPRMRKIQQCDDGRDVNERRFKRVQKGRLQDVMDNATPVANNAGVASAPGREKGKAGESEMSHMTIAA